MDQLFKLGWLLTEKLGWNDVTWKVDEAGDTLEIWASNGAYFSVEAGEREGVPVYSVLFGLDPEQTEPLVVREAVDFGDYADAAHDIITKTKGAKAMKIGSGFKITKLWAFIAVDPNDGDEGLPAMNVKGQWIPMVAADEKRIESLRELAAEMAKSSGSKIRLVRFDNATELETFEP